MCAFSTGSTVKGRLHSGKTEKKNGILRAPRKGRGKGKKAARTTDRDLQGGKKRGGKKA